MTKGKKMPSNKREKVTASSRAHISTQKFRESFSADNWIIYPESKDYASAGKQPDPSGYNPVSAEPTNDTIMAILMDIVKSNRSLTGWIEKFETHWSVTSSPINPRPHCHDQAQPWQSTSQQALHMHYQAGFQDQFPSTHASHGLQPEITRPYLSVSNQDPTLSGPSLAPTHQNTPHRDEEQRDVIMTDPSVLICHCGLAGNTLV